MKQLFSIYRINLSNESLKAVEKFLQENNNFYAYIESINKQDTNLCGIDVDIVVLQPSTGDFYEELDWGDLEQYWRDSDAWTCDIEELKQKTIEFKNFCNSINIINKQIKKLIFEHN